MKVKEVQTLFMGLTNRCNGRCLACWHSNAMPFPSHELPKEMYASVRDKFFRHIKTLDLAGGGEVFYYSGIKQVLEDMKRYKFRTTITSNFTAMNEEQKEILTDCNVEFVVSLDGSHAQLQEFLRPNCPYETVLENIQFFVKHRKQVTLQVTVSNHNFYDMRNMLKLAEKLKVHRVKFQSVQFLRVLDKPYKFNKPPQDMDFLNGLAEERFKVEYDIFLDFYAKPYAPVPNWCMRIYRFWMRNKKRKYCPNTRNMIKIQEDGKILSCCLPESRVMGNLENEKLEEVITSERYDHMRMNCSCQMVEFYKNLG